MRSATKTTRVRGRVAGRGRTRRRAAAVLISGAVAVGAGLAGPAAPAAVAAAPVCNHIDKNDRPLLNESSHGDAVAQAQCLIGTRSGYSTKLDVSGMYGPETTAAVRWVQKCNQVAESGETDEATWKVLYRAKKGCGKPRSSGEAEPGQPGKPDKPGKPAGDKPAKPGKPSGPGKPGKPAESGKPAKPAKPPKPAHAAERARSADGVTQLGTAQEVPPGEHAYTPV
ncbi:peptidoglycan-binding domain-containing protein [Uniformispora flossi]|uniref:peptidoglycan-binding domain-containing protein n=1 Tax=Uniformispora flossi TaxID=3390723 RepID=UPI003C2F9A7F